MHRDWKFRGHDHEKIPQLPENLIENAQRGQKDHKLGLGLHLRQRWEPLQFLEFYEFLLQYPHAF